MSKVVKDLITTELSKRFDGLDGVAVINPRGIGAIKNNLMRRKLHEKGLRMTVVKNTLARRAVKDDSKIKGFDKLLDGPSAVIYGKGASMSGVARLLLEEKKADDKIELRGIFFDGELYTGDKGVEQVSKLPTREEAIGNLVGIILSPGAQLAAALKAPGGRLGAVLKAIEEKGGAPESAAPEAAAPAAAAPEAPAAAPAAPETPAGDAGAAPTA